MTLALRTTPKSEFICPRAAFDVDLENGHTVTATVNPNEYTCTCGATFKWEDQTHYELHPAA